MQYTSTYQDSTADISALFRAAFSASEGPAEGQSIGALVQEIFATTAPADLSVFTAHNDDGVLGGAAIFSRIRFADDPRNVTLLSPMAVAPAHQGRGIGRRLLEFAFDGLRGQGVAIALTYGDIGFYGHCGFAQINEAVAQPPFPLSAPHGWLGRSLDTAPLTALRGPSTCIPALRNPAFW